MSICRQSAVHRETGDAELGVTGAPGNGQGVFRARYRPTVSRGTSIGGSRDARRRIPCDGATPRPLRSGRTQMRLQLRGPPHGETVEILPVGCCRACEAHRKRLLCAAPRISAHPKSSALPKCCSVSPASIRATGRWSGQDCVPTRRERANILVGWVERSETHHLRMPNPLIAGFRCALPSLRIGRKTSPGRILAQSRSAGT
jgi:hypothetical protein